MKISGVGETKLNVIEYRNNKGPFNKKEDIMNVKGISKVLLKK